MTGLPVPAILRSSATRDIDGRPKTVGLDMTTKVPCNKCGAPILSITAERTGGLCRPCEKGHSWKSCEECGKPTLGAVSGTCLSCIAEKERRRSTRIDEFISTHGSGNCTVLRQIYRFDERTRREGGGWIGLNLIDPPEHYLHQGTILYQPGTTPDKTAAFAHTGGDDVHFSLVEASSGFGDESLVVMTVPMAGDDVDELNVIVGGDLHEFLCLGCMHGFFGLEDLVYNRQETVDMLSGPPRDQDSEDLAMLEHFRQELQLTPWKRVAERLDELENQYKCTLTFQRSS